MFFDEPPDGQRRLAVGPHFDGHLVGRAADATRLHFHSYRYLFGAFERGGLEPVPGRSSRLPVIWLLADPTRPIVAEGLSESPMIRTLMECAWLPKSNRAPINRFRPCRIEEAPDAQVLT